MNMPGRVTLTRSLLTTDVIAWTTFYNFLLWLTHTPYEMLYSASVGEMYGSRKSPLADDLTGALGVLLPPALPFPHCL